MNKALEKVGYPFSMLETLEPERMYNALNESRLFPYNVKKTRGAL